MTSKLMAALEAQVGLIGAHEGTPAHERKAFSDFYQLLQDLAAGKLLIDDKNGYEHEPHLPQPLRELSRKVREVFRKASREVMEDRLSELVKHLRGDEPLRRLAEARLVLQSAYEWLRKLRASRLGSFTASLAPSLDLTLHEEDLSKGASKSILVTISWLYEGTIPATNIRVLFEASDLTVHPEGDLRRDLIADGEVFETSFRIENTGEGLLRVWLSYNSLPGASEEESSPDKEFRVKSFQPSRAERPINPFVPDSPINADVHWHILALGHHQNHVARLSAELANGARFVALRGLRRSGKSTVLLRTWQALCDAPHALPVYINIHTWGLTLEKHGSTIDDLGLLYEIADTTLSTAEQRGLGIERSDKFVRRFSETMKLGTRHDFHHFVGLFHNETGCTPILLLDDLDAWLNKIQFPEDDLLAYLREIADQGRCSVAAAYSWSDDKWARRLQRLNVFPCVIRVEMLERPDTISITRLSNCLITELAEELIWRLTGGWPGLLQLLLYACHEESARGRLIMDADLVRRVTAKLLRSSDWKSLVRHLFEAIPSREAQALRDLAFCKRVSFSTGCLKEVWLPPENEPFILIEEGTITESPDRVLQSLMEMQILEPTAPKSNHLRLRVGLLSQQQIWQALLASPIDA